ncbi:Vesicle transport V-snare protein, partial [Coemansia brasiliensis]
MSLDLFNNYESEYNSLVSAARHRLDTALPELTGANRSTAIRETERELEDAQELVGQMEMELLSLQGPERSRAAPRMRQYKAEVEQLKREARKAAQGLGNYESNRRALFGDSVGMDRDLSGDDGSLDSDNRTRLLSGSERLARGSQRLQDSHRIAIETEAVGANILNDLRAQREQIVNTRDVLLQGESHIDRSQRTLRTMTR